MIIISHYFFRYPYQQLGPISIQAWNTSYYENLIDMFSNTDKIWIKIFIFAGKKSKTSPPSLPSRGKRFKQRGKEKAPNKRRGSEMKKDIFLLPHPVYQRIPLKSARTNYHKKKLVITGLTWEFFLQSLAWRSIKIDIHKTKSIQTLGSLARILPNFSKKVPPACSFWLHSSTLLE